ncbi:unnamed protein product [Rotaria sp. Silwood1]|nr:unnamed protein product [Rotaria sp. Silwood1]
MPHVPWQKCIECNKVVENPRPINSILLKLYLSARTQLRIDSTCYVCKACRSKFDRWHHKVKGQVDQLILDKSSNENDYELEVRGIYVSPGARCCGDHFYKGQLTYEAIHQIVPFKSELVTFNSNEIQKIITDFRALVQNQEAFDFDNNASLDDTAYYNITDQFNDLLEQIQSMRKSKIRSIRVALAVFLANFRLSLSNRILATMFCLKDKRTVAHIINQVRQALKLNFVPHHIGLNHINRQSVIDHHQTAVATALLAKNSNQLCIVMDGTYLRIQKSRNYQIKQSKSYIDEHLQPSYLDEDDLEFVVELCDKQIDLLRVRFHSRHSNIKYHIATVQYDDNQEQPI